jgi:ribose transport system substrate-binding protein
MKPIKVVLSLITRDNDYQREQASLAETTARRLGMELQVLYANNDAIEQTKQILGALQVPAAERPAAVIVEPVGTGMIGVATAAAGRGAGWIVLNREADYLLPLRESSSVPIGSVECDNTEVGRIQGRQFAALLPAGGTMMYIEGPGTDVTRQRRAGVEETLPSNIVLKTFKGRWTEESGYQVMESALQRQGSQPPGVGVVGCQNDAMAMGARKAVEALPPSPQRDRWLQLPFTGVDGVPGTGQAWVRERLLAATVVAPTLTGVALEMLAKSLATGAPFPERTLLEPTSFPPVQALRANG